MITVELEILQIFGDFRQEGRCEINGSDSFQVSAGKEREFDREKCARNLNFWMLLALSLSLFPYVFINYV